MFFAFILIIFGVFLFFRVLKKQSSKSALKNITPKTEGEILNNPYILNHEKKMADDSVYDEYLEWCKVKGEIPADKEGFDEIRMKEFHLYKKLLKSGIGGL